MSDRRERSKPTLRLIDDAREARDDVPLDAPVVLLAPAPALSGEPGTRPATCTDVTLKQRGHRTLAVLSFTTDSGESGRLWVEVPQPITAGCRFWRLVTLACGGTAPATGTALDAQHIFIGKRFSVFVGYRRTPNARGGGRADDALAMKRKDSADFLRISDVLERL